MLNDYNEERKSLETIEENRKHDTWGWSTNDEMSEETIH